jgi:hypothetical protein
MRKLKNLNPLESISKRRLIFDEDWNDKFNRLAVYLVFSPLILLPLLIMYFQEKYTNSNETFVLYWVFPISIILGLYMLYRNATEKQLVKINAQIDSLTIRKLLLDYAEKNNFEVYRKSNNCLIFNESFDIWSSDSKKTRIFFVQDNNVLFTVIQDNFRLNLPTMFTHILLKRDITKLLKKAST